MFIEQIFIERSEIKLCLIERSEIKLCLIERSEIKLCFLPRRMRGMKISSCILRGDA